MLLDRLPTLDPSSGQQGRERPILLVPPVVAVDPGCAAELGAREHQRLVQLNLGLEV